MKRLFYVRHGETEMNVNKLWSGQIETPLTKTGHNQARETGKHIQNNLPNIDLILCSPLSRAQHTAQIIADEIDYPLDKIVTDDLLIERSFGALEGLSNADYFDTNSVRDLDDVDGSETVLQMHERAIKALEVLRELPQDVVLVVSHGTFGRALRRVVEDLPHTHEYDDAHREKFRLGNAEIIELI